MIITKKIYNDEGELVSEMATYNYRPIWTWIDLVISMLLAMFIFLVTVN